MMTTCDTMERVKHIDSSSGKFLAAINAIDEDRGDCTSCEPWLEAVLEAGRKRNIHFNRLDFTS